MKAKCIYFAEGFCEEQLISALKLQPARLASGKVKVYNIIQKLIPKSQLLSIQPGTIVVLIFDTDVPITEHLLKNIALLKRYCQKVKIVYLAQVFNLEDELVRCTDVETVQELTRSKGNRNFKSDFCKLKNVECRNLLERHHVEVAKLWTTKTEDVFGFVRQNGSLIKTE